jgi:hypothetical protein
VAAATFTRTCPGSGSGTGSVTIRSTEASPNSVNPIARISAMVSSYSDNSNKQ